jgi:hypothetical protein
MFRDVEEIIRRQIKVSLFLLIKKKECNSIFLEYFLQLIFRVCFL